MIRRLAIALLLTSGSWPLQCATLERLSLDDMILKSTSIVRGTVTTSSAAFQGPIIFTHYKIQVSETLKGASAAVVDVMVPGGAARGLRQAFAGAPELGPGVQYVFFLWTGKTGTQIIGLTQGLFQLPQHASGSSNAVRHASTEMMLEPVSGRMVHDERIEMRLSDLRARIAATLSKGGTQ